MDGTPDRAAQDGRIVLHVDMDAFYAAVETLERPALRDVPVVIGADPKGGRGRGVVSTANYAARRFGIHSAMPISQAWAACPRAVFLRPDFRKYKAASRTVMEVLGEYGDELEVVGMDEAGAHAGGGRPRALEAAGLDEAYLDVTEHLQGNWDRASAFCRSLQAAVRRATGLSCSVGAAPTKSAAKIASDRHKPHGVTVVPPDAIRSFLDPLPVRLANGCGPKTAQRLSDMGYETIGELARADLEGIEARFGQHGAWLWNVANGHDPRPVRADRGPGKSRGNERTFLRDERDMAKAREVARRLTDGLLDPSGRGRHDRRAFSTLTVKLRYHDFTTLTRARTLSIPVQPGDAEAASIVHATVASLLDPLLDGRAVRLVGVRLSGFTDATGQQTLARFGMAAAPQRVAARAAQA